jgi:hypothetical protein
MTEQELFDIFAAGYHAGYSDTPLTEAFEQWLDLQEFQLSVETICNKEQQ